MKKSIKIILTLLFIASISTLNFTYAYGEEGGDKACVLTIASPDNAEIECKGEGAICSTNQECFRVFFPVD